MTLRIRGAGRKGGAMDTPHAIIDIGSNTVRMVIFGGPPRAPAVLFNEKVTAKLGKGVAENGQLSAKSMMQAHAALRRFAALLQLLGVADCQCVATAAVRDATNGAAFLETVAALGLAPRLLSGEDEALASARGVLAAFPGAHGVVADLGGGSLELIDIAGDAASHGCSLPLGTLRLAELRGAGPEKFARAVHDMIGGAALDAAPGQTLYLVGGSWRALARYAMHAEASPLDDPHGHEMAPAALLALAQKIGAEKLDEVPGISRSRLASLPAAAALLAVLVRELQPARLVFSSWGLREGLLAARLSAPTLAQDPLLAGVAAFCETFGVTTATGSIVAGWTALANPAEGSGGEPLRLAATLLALASMQVEPNLRARQALEWALHKRWTGIDGCGRAVLAMTALANTGQTAIPDDLARLAPASALHEAVAWGLAIRICRKLSGCALPALAGSALTREVGALVLTVRRPLDALISDSIARDLAALAAWLGAEPQVVVIEPGAPL